MVFRWPGDRSQAWVKRVVGLPGDRIQMRQGQLFINDRPAELKPDGVGAAEDDNGGSEPAYRYVETLPNGVSAPDLQDARQRPLDNTQEVTVPAGHLFVLGDNRDNSADSRVPLRSGGVGLLPVDNLVGRADAVLGSWDLGMRGQPVWTWLSGFRSRGSSPAVASQPGDGASVTCWMPATCGTELMLLMTFDDVRKFALTWPEVEDGTSYGTPALKVRKKMLARLKEDGDSLVMPDVPIDERAMLVESRPKHLLFHRSLRATIRSC